MIDEAVKVAVRVRPFNQRERDRMAKLTIEMQGNTTIITNPENPNDKKTFTFDYSYWSHDGFKEDENGILIKDSSNSKYASQQNVFDNLGRNVLENAFNGYNCSLFAYGQTGSGKSYSMVGYGANKGIVPIVCNELFQKMEANSSQSMRYEVKFSMLEIYNENVRDLLSKESIPKGGLPVRQTPNQGFYVQGLQKVPVGSYKEIESRMDQGTSCRTVAMTNMNATSSRAHTVVIITFIQIMQSNGSDIRKSSIINLVDLAGSERADSTGATGDRLKEGANINKSLSVLGNVISALADLSSGKKKVVVPYRDSVLTKLLQNALGGNSKTVMIAALSPADINYDETLGTLRYADRAKQIKNKAIVNENPMDKLLRELKEENERLKQTLTSGNLPQNINTQGLSPEEINDLRKEIMEELKAQMVVNSEIIETEDPKIFTAKLEEARKEVAIISMKEKKEVNNRKKIPHLFNLNEDPHLSGVILHYLTEAKTLITRIDNIEECSDDNEDEVIVKSKKKKETKHNNRNGDNKNNTGKIILKGLSISNRHAIIERRSDGSFIIKPALAGAKTKINGHMLSSEVVLNHKDRILFGSNHMYLFINPLNAKDRKNLPKIIDWEFAQSEIAHADGFETEDIQGLTKDQQIVQQQILEILPMISEVNAISEELGKCKTFRILLVPPNSQDSIFGAAKRTAIVIKATDTQNGNFWLWERGKFMNRRYLMQELYQQFLEDNTLKQEINTTDPFWEPADEVLLGTANVFLQSLAFNLDFDDKIPILNYEASEEGFIYVAISPSNSNGKVKDEDNFVDDPRTLLTRTYHFLINISKLELNNTKYTHGIRIRYRVFKDERSYETELYRNTNTPKTNYNKVISFARISQEHLDYFENGYITFRVYVNQEEANFKANKNEPTQTFIGRKIDNRRLSVIPVVESLEEISKLKSDLTIISKKLERLEKKDRMLKTVCKDFKTSNNENYETFYKSINTILFGGENLKFKTDGFVISSIMKGVNNNTTKSKENEMNPSDKENNHFNNNNIHNSNNNNNINNNNNSNNNNNNFKPKHCLNEPLLEEDEILENESRSGSSIFNEVNTSKTCILM